MVTPADRSRAPRVAWGLLALAVAVNLGAAAVAALVTPAGCDLLFHGLMVEAARDALVTDGWAAFQDPMVRGFTGGYPLFRVYPHLVHHITALVAAATASDPWTVLSVGTFVGVAVLPLVVFSGGRLLGLGPVPSALAALVIATSRSVGIWGHTPLDYGFISGYGMYAQLWGMALAAVAFPAWLAASRAGGGTLARLPAWVRVAGAGVLLSLLVRTHLPAGIVVILLTPWTLAWTTPVRGWPAALVRCGAVGAVGLLLATGFLVPWLAELWAVSDAILEPPEVLASVGARAVLGNLARGTYLDGGVPGPWTLALAATVGVVAWRGIVGRGAERTPQERMMLGLAAAAGLSAVLLFGRTTWGGWVDAVPLFGRFFDCRYLLGLHLTLPWLIAAGLAHGFEAIPGRWRRVASITAVAGLGLAAVLQVVAIRAHLRAIAAHQPPLDAMIADLQPVVDDARRHPFEPVALGGEAPSPGGVDASEWLLRQGAPARGNPTHHYGYGVPFAKVWTAWIADAPASAGHPAPPGDLRAGMASRLLFPPGTPGTRAGYGNPAPRAGWDLRSLPPLPTQRGDVALVRSDLLVRAEQRSLDGMTLAWFSERLYVGRQHPTIHLARAPEPDTGRYLRTIDLSDRDVTQLRGLPTATPTNLGEIHRVEAHDHGPGRTIEVTAAGPDSWLLIGVEWHPGWRAEVDGAEQPLALLVPGFLGLPLPEGDSTVTLWWPVAPWRGWWAAANMLLCLGIGGTVAWSWRRGGPRASSVGSVAGRERREVTAGASTAGPPARSPSCRFRLRRTPRSGYRTLEGDDAPTGRSRRHGLADSVLYGANGGVHPPLLGGGRVQPRQRPVLAGLR